MTHQGPDFLSLDAPPVLIFGGKGGVGKTTTAAATAWAIALAAPDQRVLLVSTDPAHSVADAMGESAPTPANLGVVEIDASAEHAAFMAEHAGTLREIASRGTFLGDEEIARFLDLSVPGVDELMCFLRIARWLSEDRADRYVIDTAPTGHALRLLTMPTLLEGWLGAVDALLGKHRYMAGLFGGRGRSRDGVENFVEEHGSMFDHAAAVLTDPRAARFVAVFNAETLSVSETARLLDQLDELGIDAPELVLNRVVPAAAGGALAAVRTEQRRVLADLPPSIASRRVWACPLQADEPRGASLPGFFADAAPLDATTATAEAGRRGDPLVVRGLVDLPATGPRPVTLVAGKGGVGKTSVACAIALATAAEGLGRTLLVSTDPAGSLSDALGVEVGPEPTAIAPGLHAVQLDADAELQALRDTYAEELRGFFENFSVDLSFDAEALERLLDLAPTGVDEVMALVRMTEILAEQRCDRLILDTAPTGHTLRLLELPAVVRGWLSEILGVLARYSHVIHLPRINERLIRFSKGLNALRTMLADERSCHVLAVAIPTHLSAAETRRLVDGCARAGVGVAGLVVNMVSPPLEGAWSALNAREEASLSTLRTIAGSRPVAEISRGAPPQGAAALSALGTALLRPAAPRVLAA